MFAAILAEGDREAFFEGIIHGLMVKEGPSNFTHFVKVCFQPPFPPPSLSCHIALELIPVSPSCSCK